MLNNARKAILQTICTKEILTGLKQKSRIYSNGKLQYLWGGWVQNENSKNQLEFLGYAPTAGLNRSVWIETTMEPVFRLRSYRRIE